MKQIDEPSSPLNEALTTLGINKEKDKDKDTEYSSSTLKKLTQALGLSSGSNAIQVS